jgi:hypothetical protein
MWEYKVVNREARDLDAALLNELGADGWELVAVASDSDDRGRLFVTAYFKRPKR